MDFLQMISVPVIALVVYWVVNLIKYTVNENEKFKRFIPLLSAGLGLGLGILCYYVSPSIIAAPNVWVAMVSGASSGLTATGFHQMIKQMSDGNVPSQPTKTTADKTELTDKTQNDNDTTKTK